MVFTIFQLIGGFFLLYLGAEWLVHGASRLAKSLGVKPLVIGLTVVAFGTSAPELLVSVTAALKKESAIALGNVIGSNIANIGLVLGISALFWPLKCSVTTVKREIPIMILSPVILYLFTINGKVGLSEGLILFICLCLFIGYNYFFIRREPPQVATEVSKIYGTFFNNGNTKLKWCGLIILGLGTLLVSAHFVIRSAVTIAESIGISHKFIGLTLVAVGTSLPELITSAVAALRKEPDISVGNVVGSNIFNIFSVIGITAMITPLTVNQGFLLEFIGVTFFSVLLIPLMLTENRISRLEGFWLVVLYFGYMAWLGIRS